MSTKLHGVTSQIPPVRIERVSRFLQNDYQTTRRHIPNSTRQDRKSQQVSPKCLSNYTASHPKFHPLRLKMFSLTLVLRQIKQCLLTPGERLLEFALSCHGYLHFVFLLRCTRRDTIDNAAVSEPRIKHNPALL